MIFLDVGAHEGQTLEEVTKPAYGFDRIYAFEPMPAQYAVLVRRFGDNPAVALLPFGLSDRDEDRPLYGDNANMGSSIYAEKRDVDAGQVTSCRFVSASAFLDELPRAVPLTVKLNCEGAEVPILDDLIDSGEIHRIANLLIDFDIRKVEGREGEEQRILAKLDAAGFRDFVLAEEVMQGATHQDRIAAWLSA